MGSFSYNAAILQYEDLVCMKDRIDTLCHDDDGSVTRFPGKLFSKCRIRFIIQCGKAVIKDQYLRLLCDGTGNGQTLLLSAGYIRSALGDLAVLLLFLLLDKLGGLSDLCRFLHLLIGDKFPCKFQI